MKDQNGPNQNKERKIAWPFIPSHDLLKKGVKKVPRKKK